MNLEQILQYIRPELLILIVFIYALGLFLKKAPWFKNEWTIPFLLLGVGVLFTVLYMGVVLGEGFTGKTVLVGIIQGVLITALAVFGNELLKQAIVKRKIDSSIHYNPDYERGNKIVANDKLIKDLKKVRRE